MKAAGSANLSLWVELTGRCNWNCNFCYNDWRDGTRSAEPVPISSHDLIVQFQRLVERVTFEYVALSGGEPLLSPNLWPALAFFAERNIPTVLTTNGALLNRVRALRLKRGGLGGVQVSFISLDPQVHQRVVGADTWQLNIAGICQSLEAGLPTSVVVTATIENIDYLSEIVVFLKQLGIQRLLLNDLQRAGSVLLEQNSSSSRVVNFDAQIESAINTARRVGLELQRIPPAATVERTHWHRLVITPDAKLKICNVAADTIGSLPDLSEQELSKLIKDIVETELEIFRSPPPECSCLARRLRRRVGQSP